MKTEAFVFETSEPWAGTVPTAELLSEIEGVIRKHVVLNDHAAAALAVWVLHTYTFELRDAVAYVAIESPEKRCGKTTLISVLAALAHRPLIASNITVGALFRAIDTCRPTLFIDEADTFLAGNGAMRGILNSGNTWRTAYVLRLSKQKSEVRGAKCQVEDGGNIEPAVATAMAGRHRTSNPPSLRSYDETGAEHRMRGGERPPEPDAGWTPALGRRDACPTFREAGDVETGLRRYSCWCPKVIALIGEVPDTIADRSIVVKMSRKLVTEACAPLTELDTTEIRAKCARFALDAGQAIAQAGKIRGEGLNDRAADTFEPLYVIARHAGGDWEGKLQAAAQALTATAQRENPATELLLDILSIFAETGREKIFSRVLLGLLRDGLDGIRSTALKESALNENGIAKALRPYGIRPTVVRIGTAVTRGYVCADFREALRRYVPRMDADARIAEFHRRVELRAEARAEAAREAALSPDDATEKGPDEGHAKAGTPTQSPGDATGDVPEDGD